jgi:hypothetical protein
VDRDEETKVFASMLQFQTSRRVMLVSDKRGRGKTDLLRKLRYQCEAVFDPPVPVAMFDFEVNGVTAELDIVDHLAEQLVAADVPVNLPHYDDLSRARLEGQTGQFVQAWSSARGSIDLSGAHLSGEAQAAGIINNFNVESGATLVLPDWNDGFDRQARRLCQEAFFSDLLTAAREQPIVLLFDTVNAADDVMRRWLLRDLMKRRLLNGWEDHRLIAIIAGTDVEDLVEPLSGPLLDGLEPLASLTGWESEHVRAFLAAHGYANLSDEDIEVVQVAIASGKSLVTALQVAAVIKESA